MKYSIKKLYRELKERCAKNREARQKRSRQEAALKKYGWDATCPGCKNWFHADKCGINSTHWDRGWIYECKCGMFSKIFADFPIPHVVESWRKGDDNPCIEKEINQEPISDQIAENIFESVMEAAGELESEE